MVMADDAKERKRQRRSRERELQHALGKRAQDTSNSSVTGNANDPPAADAAAVAGKPKLKESDITGLKYFDQLAPLLERLHDDGCDRDKAGNRKLHFDQYGLLILLYLFHPVVTSLRGIQQASELGKVQKKLGCSRASLGSLSEAAGVFDADRLKEIIAELGAQLKPLGRDTRLKDIDQTLVLVDGTLIEALPRIMEASWRKQNDGSGLVKWRLHTHFEVDRYVPTRIDVTPDGGGRAPTEGWSRRASGTRTDDRE